MFKLFKKVYVKVTKVKLLCMNNLLRKIYFPLLVFSGLLSKAEGTKQLRPAYTDDNHIVAMADDINFASYDTASKYRLQFYVKNLSERVYFGFGRIKADLGAANNRGNIATYNEDLTGGNPKVVYYRIISPSGLIVMAGQVPTAGQGYIGDHNLQPYDITVNGPKQLVGNVGGLGNFGGYWALKLIPTEIGDYRIQFNYGDQVVPQPRVKLSFQLFDLTVTDGKGTFDADGADSGPPATKAIDGRVWSKYWRFSTGSNQDYTDPFLQNLVKCKLYPYAEDGNPATKDGVVTEINFNGMDPFGYSVSCNKYGIKNTNNFVPDKRSVYDTVFYNLPSPMYKIFLTPPDSTVYPSGVVGCLTGTPTVTQCASGSAYCINIFAAAVGDVNILIDLNGNDGLYTPGTRDVLIRTSINGVANPKCVPWNGKDGLGIQVPDGNVSLVVDFQAGLTNLPINDVENHLNGFIVKLVRPLKNFCNAVINPPLLYWSDSLVVANTIAPYTATAIDGIENLIGCDPTAQGPGVGCHRWSGRGLNTDPNGYIKETMNTWWYIARDRKTISFLNDNSLFGITPNFGNVPCAFKDFEKISVDVEYSLAKYNPALFKYKIKAPEADNYKFVNQTILGTNLPGSSPGKRIVRIQYNVDINKDSVDTGGNVLGISFDYRVRTNQCGSNQDVSKNFNCSVPLPVSWIYFWANKTNEKTAILEWTTSQEVSNNGFWIERSTDGKIFTSLAFIKGNQNTNEKSTYTYTDNQVPSTICYYRLKQIDNQDIYNYSKIISVGSDVQTLSLISCFYENADKILKIELAQSYSGDINLNLYNMLGVIVNQKSFGKMPANQPIELQTQFPQLSTGIYIVEIKNDQQIVRKKIFINN